MQPAMALHWGRAKSAVAPTHLAHGTSDGYRWAVDQFDGRVIKSLMAELFKAQPEFDQEDE